MQVIFDTKILKQLDKEIDDYYENYKSRNGIISEILDRILGMRIMLSRIEEIIIEEDLIR